MSLDETLVMDVPGCDDSNFRGELFAVAEVGLHLAEAENRLR